MSESSHQWIAVILFGVLLVAIVIAEVFWLIRKGLASPGAATAYVLITDLVSLGIGSVIVFAIGGLMVMMTFGPQGNGGDAPEIAYWAALIVSVMVPTLILIALKRLFLLIFSIRHGKVAWLYALTSSLSILIVAFVVYPLILYLVEYSTRWK